MKLKINGFENEIQFDDEHINVLTIDNFVSMLCLLDIKVSKKVLRCLPGLSSHLPPLPF